MLTADSSVQKNQSNKVKTKNLRLSTTQHSKIHYTFLKGPKRFSHTEIEWKSHFPPAPSGVSPSAGDQSQEFQVHGMGLLKVTGRDSLIKTKAKTNKKNRLNMQVLTR